MSSLSMMSKRNRSHLPARCKLLARRCSTFNTWIQKHPGDNSGVFVLSEVNSHFGPNLMIAIPAKQNPTPIQSEG